MATITVGRGRRAERFPDICARCGAPAVLRKSKNFSWCPPWVVLLLFVAWPVWLIVTILLTKRRQLDVPLCQQHRHHWLWSLLLILGGFTLLGGTGVLGLVLAQSKELDTLGGVTCAATGVGLLVWLIVALVVQNRTIRPKEITDDRLSLVGVCQEFADAYEDRADEDEDVERGVRERWRDSDRGRARDEEDEDAGRYQRGQDEDDRPRRRRERDDEDY